MRPIDGWAQAVTTVGGADTPGFAASPIRLTHTWITRDGIKRTAILCEEHLYVMTAGGDVSDITPTGGIAGPGDDIAGGYGDDIYYGARGGLSPRFAAPDAATPLPPIFEDPNGYGKERPDRPPNTIAVGPMYSLDNFGDTLLAMTSVDARLLEWDPNTAGVLAKPVVADTDRGVVPLGRCFVVTPERHVMIFGDGNIFNKFCWCSQEDMHDWLYADQNNSAGFYELEPAAPFVTASVSRYGVLVFTVTETYLVTYAGSPFVYTYAFLGNYNAPLAGNAITALANRTVWQASDGYWTFDGVNVSPLPCTLLDWTQQLIDPIWKFRRCFAVPIGVQSEVWFFFPARNATENTHFAAYNFDERWWSQGQLRRTCGEAGSSLTYPIMSDGQVLFFHENGRFYGDAPMLPYAQTSAINVSKGARRCTVRQGIADTRAPAADVLFRVGARKARIANPTNFEDVQFALAVRRDGGKVDFRVTGRDIFIRIESTRNGSEPWTFGQMLVKVTPRGER
jgi:hypothetical protein